MLCELENIYKVTRGDRWRTLKNQAKIYLIKRDNKNKNVYKNAMKKSVANYIEWKELDKKNNEVI